MAYQHMLVGASLAVFAAFTGGMTLAQEVAPPPTPASALTEQGFGLFQEHCVGCHGNPAYERAPSPQALREMSPDHIFQTLSPNGIMYPVVGKDLTEVQRKLVAESISGSLIGVAQSGDAAHMPNRCANNPPLPAPGAGPAWNGWGAGLSNRRFQNARAAGLSAADLPKLKLKWAFGYPDGISAYGQPAMVSGRIFVGTDTGFIYSLDAKSGCVYWSYQTKASVRTAMTVGPIAGHSDVKYAVYFGDMKSNAYAVDAQTGSLLWTRKVDENLTDRITAAPALYRGVLYVPVSSWEEVSARTLDFSCCTSVGSIVALDTAAGRQLWKTYVIAQRPKVVGRNSKGVELWAPAGGAVWNTPTLDPKRGAIYFGTGDATTYPAPPTTDAVMALSMADGHVLWSYQVTHHDSFLVGCWGPGVTENCPKVEGPDWDIPASVVLHKLSHGKRALIVGTKPGDILALDPDAKGALLWRVNLTRPELAGDGPLPKGEQMTGVMWGFSDDGRRAYFGLRAGGVVALDLETAKRAWFTPLNAKVDSNGRPPAALTPGFTAPATIPVSHGDASTAIAGAVLLGGTDGELYALSSVDGRVLWSFDTARNFDTVNKVKAHGGSIGDPGPVVAGGMVFVGSGYSVTRGKSGNVLLAFAP